jgi:hypothetical protein
VVSAICPRGDELMIFDGRLLPGSAGVAQKARGDGVTDVHGTLAGKTTIPAGHASTRISIEIYPDTITEPSQYVFLEISRVEGADPPFGTVTLEETAWIESSDLSLDLARPVHVSDVTLKEPENGVAEAHLQFETPNEPSRGFMLVHGLVSGAAMAGVDHVTDTFTHEVADSAAVFGMILATATATINDTPPPAFMSGTSGVDDFKGPAIKDQFDLLAGDDRLHARAGTNVVLGLAGHDLTRAQVGADGMAGGAGRDRPAGGEGTDSLLGEDGNDTLFGGAGDGCLQGGGGGELHAALGARAELTDVPAGAVRLMKPGAQTPVPDHLVPGDAAEDRRVEVAFPITDGIDVNAADQATDDVIL